MSATIGQRPHEYEIRCLEDFTKVPADRLQDCLTDFVSWLALVRRADDVAAVVNGLVGVEGAVELNRDHFTWVDDGLTGQLSALEFTVKDTDEHIGRIDLKDRKPMVCKHSRLARKCEICDLEERCENAERIILLLTADHNTGETYQKGFEAAREHFADYPHKAAL